jgi:hypothetical protein
LIGAYIRMWFIEGPKQAALFLLALAKFFTELPGKIEAWANDIRAKFDAWLLQMSVSLAIKLAEMLVALALWFTSLPGKIDNWLSTTWQKFTTWWHTMLTSLQQWGINAIKEVSTWPDRFFKWLDTLPERLRKMLEEFGQKIDEGLKSAKDKALGWLNPIIDGFKTLVDWIGKGIDALAKGAKAGVTGQPYNPPYQHGGIVQGPIGSPQPILAHAGERVVSRTGVDVNGFSGGGLSITFTGPVNMDSEARVQQLADKIGRMLGRQNELARYGAGY